MTHDHDHDNELDPMAARVRALETILTQKGLIDPAAIDVIVETYETKVGPRNGAKVVAKAWSDPDYAEWLKRDATEAIASLGFTGRQGEHMQAVFNTDDTHNLVVCTLCSCYPWSVLGLPPVWYKAPPYRSRAVIDPRGVLEEFGLTLSAETKIRVWDSTAELRYLVVPLASGRHGRLGEDKLAELVTRDSMIGTGLALEPAGRMNGPQDLGGQMGLGPVAPEIDEPVFHADWEKRALGLTLCSGAMGYWNIDEGRHARENRHPVDYLSSTYYEIWTKGLEVLLKRHGFVSERDLAEGRAVDGAPPPKRVLKAADVPAVLATRRAMQSAGRRRRRGSRQATGCVTQEFQSGRPHAAAALCTRQAWRGRGGARRLCLPRQQRPRQRRKPAVGLHGRIRRLGDLGRWRRSDADGLDRRLGELS